MYRLTLVQIEIYFLKMDMNQNWIAYCLWLKKGRDDIKGRAQAIQAACYSYAETCPVLPDAACIKCQRLCS